MKALLLPPAPDPFNLDSCIQCSWSQYGLFLKNNPLSIICINMRSVTNKFAELKSHLKLVKYNPSFILVTETWLNDDKDFAYELEGYASISLHREGLGGGLKLYYLNHVSVQQLDDFTTNCGPAEILFVRATIPGFGSLNIGCVYRPPNKSTEEFLAKMNEYLELSGHLRTIIAGDFNIDTLRDTENSRDYKDMFSSYGFSNNIIKPTYVPPSSLTPKSCLDHIWANLPLPCNSYIIEPNIADHYAISCVFNKCIDEPPIILRFRVFSRINMGRFATALPEKFQYFNPPIYDIDAHAIYLDRFLRQLLDKFFPVKTKRLSVKRINSPWINTNILFCINKKHKLHTKAKNGEISFDSYKSYCSILRILLDTAEKEYTVLKLEKLGKDSARNWKILNNLLNRHKKRTSERFFLSGEYVTDHSIIANQFNEHFINHPQNISNNIPHSHTNYNDLITTNIELMEFSPATNEEVSKEISALKKNGNSVHDFSKIFLRNCSEFVSPVLCNLFNSCLLSEKFPEIFKMAKVTPVHKKGPKDDILNYRPVSILANLSKIFEGLLHRRISHYFNPQTMLSSNQFGFRRGKNTELACLSLVDRVMPAFTDKGYSICVFLDFRACFDTVSRENLLNKFEKYGLRGIPLEFVRSYLSGRKQKVVFQDKTSEVKDQELGVIQGSKNGPLFFDVYANDINNICSSGENLHFADDTCLVYSGTDLSALVDHVNQRLGKIVDWCNSNRLSLNPLKSEFLIFTNRPISFEPCLRIGLDEISRKRGVKYLGLQIDDGLSFGNHL